jgi:hypothetical protein
MEIKYSTETDRLYEIDRAVKEWKAARRDFEEKLEAWVNAPIELEQALHERLRNAEAALMKAGEGYGD